MGLHSSPLGWCNKARHPYIPCASRVHHEYEGGGCWHVADHIRGNYSCQVRTHKWWHRIFMFLMDLSIIQMYLYYLQILKKLGKLDEAITHLQFMNGLYQALSQDWVGPNQIGAVDLPRYPVIHCLRWTTYRRKCVEC
jgi:hypothetical protein